MEFWITNVNQKLPTTFLSFSTFKILVELSICMDFKQNLLLPHIPAQEILYWCQLWECVFGINNLKIRSHISTYILNGMLRQDPTKYVPFVGLSLTTYLKLSTNYIFLSDSCPSQNINHTVLRFLAKLAANGRFNKILQYFPVRGNSFLPCDRDLELLKKFYSVYTRRVSQTHWAIRQKRKVLSNNVRWQVQHKV
jgi:hypothetical protein